MKYCSTCGAELHDNAVICVKCGCPVTPPPQSSSEMQQAKNDDSPGMTLLSIVLPLIGILLYFMYKDDKPIIADGCRRGSLVGLMIGIIIALIYLAAT